MSEIIDNSRQRKELLKHMILQLHEGVAPETVKKQLQEVLKKMPYNDVVEVEQILINEGLPTEEVLRLCDVHSSVLEGSIDLSGAKPVPDGHPVDTFKKENIELKKYVDLFNKYYEQADIIKENEIEDYILKIRSIFNAVSDVDKHYRRKEYLLFPFLEKHNITGPPTVMWGKHDEIRVLIKGAIEMLSAEMKINKNELKSVLDIKIKPASNGVADMIMKEEEILLPMSMDTLSDTEWYEIYNQTNEIGYCLFDPQVEWKPAGIELKETAQAEAGNVKLSTGQFTVAELEALVNTLPLDITFIDKNDKVKFFSLGKERIFDRNRAILNRDVRQCHPPASVGIVEKIINDFKSGKESSAPFWINFKGMLVHIEYFAVRDKDGNYMGTIEITQNIKPFKEIEGEHRLLSYAKKP